MSPGEVAAIVGEPKLQSSILTSQVGLIHRFAGDWLPCSGDGWITRGSCLHLLMLSWPGARRGTVQTREYVDVTYWA